jgi:hypothetical protein
LRYMPHTPKWDGIWGMFGLEKTYRTGRA